MRPAILSSLLFMSACATTMSNAPNIETASEAATIRADVHIPNLQSCVQGFG